jgi:hypothetical protein
MWALASQSGSSSSGAQRSRRSNPFRTSGNGLQQEVRECMGIERGAPGPQVWWTRMFSLVLAFQHLRHFFLFAHFISFLPTTLLRAMSGSGSSLCRLSSETPRARGRGALGVRLIFLSAGFRGEDHRTVLRLDSRAETREMSRALRTVGSVLSSNFGSW